MALNGSFYGSTNNTNIKPKITWQAVQSQAGNYSDVTAVLTYSRTNTGYTTSGTWSGSITIGDDSASGSRYLQITYDSNTQAIAHTVRVYHDGYGAASVTISATGAISGTTLERTTISQRVTLDAIARASTIAATAAEIGQVSMIAVSRKNPAFTHSVAYRFGGLSGFIGPEGQCIPAEEKMAEGSISFQIPEEFCYQIPNSPTGICSLVCRTYDGETLIGQRQTEFTVTAGQGEFGPLVEGWVEDVNPQTLALTGDAGVLVRGYSTAGCTVAAQARGGASLTQVTVNGTAVKGDSLLIAGIETGQVTFRATDSRGYTQQITVTKPLIPYVRLTCNPTVKRTDPTSGNGRLTVVGKYFSGSFGSEENSLTLSCRVNGGAWIPLTAQPEGENDYALDVVIGSLDYDRVCTLEVAAEDALCRVVVSRTVPKGVPVFDWGEEDFSFHVPVSLDGNRLTGLADPEAPTDGVNKAYMDAHTHELPVIPVEKGGTGGQTIAQARENLGVGVATLYTGNLTGGGVSFDAGHSLYIVVGRTLASNAKVSLAIPALACDGSGYQLMADNAWVSFRMYAGRLEIVQCASGAITGIYGIN